MAQTTTNSATFSVESLKSLMAASPGLKLLDVAKLKILEKAVERGQIDIMKKLFELLQKEKVKLEIIDMDFKKQSKVLFNEYTKTLQNLHTNLLKITEKKNTKSDDKAADALLARLGDV